jgi:excinuclease ABC subunit C
MAHSSDIFEGTSLAETIAILPESPGLYQYYDRNERLLYVGKAKNLKKRVKSYFRFTPRLKPNPTLSLRILKMLNEARRMDYIVVKSEEDALILENSLIKQLKPKYNILLRDDKTYPYLFIDENETFPRFELTRKVRKGRDITYYGPFPNGGKALLDALYDCFPLVQRRNCIKEGKACLFYQIGKCLAPCEGKVSVQEYARIITDAKEAIVKRKILGTMLKKKMAQYAEQERFEEAAELRDRLDAIKSLPIASPVDLADEVDLDIIAILNGDERGVVIKLFLRRGRIISSSFSYFRQTHIYDENEAYKQTILEYYHIEIPKVPHTILVAHDFDDRKEIAATLSKRFGKKIDVAQPLRGPKTKLTALAIQNAHELLKRKQSHNYIEQQIADLLSLSTIPYRIETFDNSHMMGVATVGAMVVWDEEKWDKHSYRRYTLHERDEYGQMREMLSRRIEDFRKEAAPDLWILDGGRANLMLAQQLLKKSGIHLDVIAIAKEKLDAKAHRAKGAARDLLYCSEGIIELKTTDKRLQWIQRQRDEAHRFAITYHQNKKRREDTRLSLLEKKGIGKATIRKLIDYFGSFEAIQKSDLDTLAQVVGAQKAKAIKDREQ